MKSLSKMLSWLCISIAYMAIFVSCKKEVQPNQQPEEIAAAANNSGRGHLKQTKEYSSDVLFRWIDFQLTIYRATAVAGPTAARLLAYSGLGAYEAVVPGMPAYQSLSGQIRDLSALPTTQPGYAYHWDESLNAALARITTAIFPAPAGGGATQTQNIKNFSDGLYNEFKNQGASTELLDRSKKFGDSVGARVVAAFSHSQDDWPSNAATFPNLNPPVGTEADFDINTGKFVRISSANLALPYWPYTRLLVSGSLSGIQLINPFAYSAAPGSSFYNLVQNIYNDSYNPHGLSLAERRDIAFYYAFPGYGGGYYLSILKQVLGQVNATLDLGALILAQAGIAMHDAEVGTWTVKYDRVNNFVVRPQTYVRKVLGVTSWTAYLATLTPSAAPNHPEYPSGHSTQAGSEIEVLIQHFGNNFSFTDTTFVHYNGATGLAARHFNSFTELADEIGDSRVYGQIHYLKSCQDGQTLGRKVAQNVLSTLKFLKE